MRYRRPLICSLRLRPVHYFLLIGNPQPDRHARSCESVRGNPLRFLRLPSSENLLRCASKTAGDLPVVKASMQSRLRSGLLVPVVLCHALAFVPTQKATRRDQVLWRHLASSPCSECLRCGQRQRSPTKTVRCLYAATGQNSACGGAWDPGAAHLLAIPRGSKSRIIENYLCSCKRR